MKRSWVEISLSRLRDNVQAIRDRLRPSTQIIAVVKANAYGHGLRKMSKCLAECGIDRFAVATLEEAIEVRKDVRTGEILVFGGCLPGQEEEFRRHDLTAALFDTRTPAKGVKVEVKVDTGMTRLGIPWQRASELVRQLASPITGLFSHFACSAEDPEFTKLQLQRLEKAALDLRYPKHISNSAGLQFPEAHLDAVRPGLALYGISPCSAVDYVEPILRWKTRILSIKEVGPGEQVGYCGTFVTRRASRLGVLPVGYADGYSRRLSNRGQVKIGDRLVPVVGNISMDLLSVDLTDLTTARVGEEVTLLDDSPDSPLSAAEWARTLDTIPYEILTSIGPRVERVYLP